MQTLDKCDNKLMKLKTIIGICSLLLLIPLVFSAYTPDAYDAINITFAGSYTPDDYDAINITFLAIEGPPANDTCSCPGAGTNWEIDLEDSCNITAACNITTGNITFINNGTVMFNNTITFNNIGDLGNNTGWLGSNNQMRDI